MKHLLLSAAAMVLVAGSAAAQPQTDQHPDRQAEHPARTAPNHPQGSPVVRAPESRSFGGPANRGPTQTYAPPQRMGGYNSQGPRYAPAPSAPRYTGPARGVTPQNNWRGQQGVVQPGVIGQSRGTQFQTPPRTYNPNNRTPRSGWTAGRPNNGTVAPQNSWNRNQHNGGAPAAQSGWATGRQNSWNQGGTGHHVWDRNGDQRRGWDRNGDNNWWRGHRGFDNYQGWRQGYWFAPGWGYYQPDPNWYDYDWEVGVQVPYDLRGYYVSDPYDYGLPPAPYGCEWIFLGDEIVLIDMESGEILQIGDGY